MSAPEPMRDDPDADELALEVREPPGWATRLMGIAWPAFLLAGVMEILVFAFVDPLDVTWRGRALGISRVGVYTLAFFAFWLVIGSACALTAMLGNGRDEPRRG